MGVLFYERVFIRSEYRMNYPDETTTDASIASSHEEMAVRVSSKSKSKHSNVEARRKLEDYMADRALEKNIRDVFDDYDY